MLGFITTLLTLQGIGLGTCAAYLGAKSVARGLSPTRTPVPLHESVKLCYTEDLSGRFEVDYAYCDRETGLYYAMVSAKRKDLPILEQVYANTLDELEKGVEKAYKSLEGKWKLEMEVRKLLNGKPQKKKHRRHRA